MNSEFYTPLQMREVFHLEFLRWFGRKVTADTYALKGGVNLRLFFKSIRYSEDMDIDIQRVRVDKIQKTVMDILTARGFSDSLKFFGIEKVVPPDITKAKQTETTQRFKIHLMTSSGEDLFTKIEFSRRGLKGTSIVEPATAQILRPYKMAPLLVSHYDTPSAIAQKIQALAQRSVVQARDILDLHVLSSQYSQEQKSIKLDDDVVKTANNNIFLIDFPQFRDTVVAYLGVDDQKAYSSSAVWDEIKLKVSDFLEEFNA